jgi:hypothetical protein
MPRLARRSLPLLIALAAVSLARGDERIEHSRPQYVRKYGAEWAEKGRITGDLRHAVDGEMNLYNAKGIAVENLRFDGGDRVYELRWQPPGVYSLEIEARGHDDLILRPLRIKAKHDLRIDFEFQD